MQLDEKSRKITMLIAPEFPFNYQDVYFIVFEYLQECYLKNENYEIEEIRRKLRQKTIKGF